MCNQLIEDQVYFSSFFSLTDLRMKVTLGKLNQLPHQSRNGVSRRKVSRRAVQEEGGSREEAEAAVPAPGTTSVTSHGNTCALGSPAQQLYLQETGSWKESQEQVLRYQLSGQDQLLLPCPDLRRETQRLQGQSRLGKEHVSLGLPQEKPASCSAAETFCLHSVCPEAVQGQLWSSSSEGIWKSWCSEYIWIMVSRGDEAWAIWTLRRENMDSEFSVFNFKTEDSHINECTLKWYLIHLLYLSRILVQCQANNRFPNTR